MRKIIEKFVDFPFYAKMVIVFLTVAGIISAGSMKKSFYPESTARMIYVSVYYPGASPTEMEEGITSRIEEATRGLVGIKEITSTSSENMCTVTIETTGAFDLDDTLMEVKNAVDGISSFPSAAERPIVSKQRNTSMAVFASLRGDVDLLTLKAFAQEIEEDMLASGKVSQISLSGFPSVEISVEIAQEEMLRYGVTFQDIATAISQNNQDVSGGLIKSSEEEILIRLRSRSADPNKIGDIILKGNSNGGYIRVRDVADVKKKFEDVTSKFLEGDKPAIGIMISKLNNEDLEELTDYVTGFMEEFNSTHNGVEFAMDFSFMSMLSSRLALLSSNGIVGLILVIIALALFLNFKLSMWVAWGIPASFLAMFIAGNLMGITINMISLFGMILVIGILVDDGIVIGENIYQHFEKGASPKQAAIEGTLEVLPAVLTSVTTTIIAFMPLIFLSNAMEMMKEMAIVVILALLFSLFEAFFVLPSHLGSDKVLNRKKAEKPNRVKRGLERGINWFRDVIYARVLNFAIRWRYVVIFIPIALFMITAGLMQGGLIKSTIFPSMEFDSFNINIAFTPGSGEAKTEKYLAKYAKVAWEVNEEMMQEYGDRFDDLEETFIDKISGNEIDTTRTFIKNVWVNVGSAFNGQENGAHAGNVSVYMRNLEGLGISSHEINRRIKDKIGDVPEAEKFTIQGTNPWGMPISISLLGRDIKELEASSIFLSEHLNKMPQLKNVVDNNVLGKQEVRLELTDKAYALGLTEQMITSQVRSGFYGYQAQRLQEGRDELRVWIRFPSEDRETIGQLDRMKISTPSGVFPLKEIVDYTIERGPVSIKRYNGKREIRVEADITKRDESVTDIQAKLDATILKELKEKYPSVSIAYQGQQKESGEAMEVVSFYYLIAFLIIIMILMIHFKSFKQPILVLAMIPLSILGCLWGHGIEGKQVSMLSLWGIVALTGVIVNDAVVFLSTFNDNIKDGKSLKYAIIDAGKSRLRPILLTTVTTTIGLYPLILEKSFQAQFLIPMAISLAYGVAIGTAFILIFLPSFIHILNDVTRYSKYFTMQLKVWMRYGDLSEVKLPSAEEVETAMIHKKQVLDK